MKEYWIAAAEWLTSQTGVTVICAGIVIWALLAFVRFRRRIVPLIKLVDKALVEIESFDGESGFAHGIDAFEERIRTNSVLGRPWSEFSETLIRDPELVPFAVRNTRAASDYFSRANVIGDRLNLRFYSALPNLLTGTGILGTFAGLVAGIGLASGDLSAADLATVKQGLQDLLSGASLAFFTSIAGLITSILFSWKEKHWIHRFDSRLARWNDQLESRLRRVTDGSLLSEQLAQGRQQTEILTQFTQDLAFQIANAFQEQMTASVGPVMERILETLEGLREDQGRRNDDALKEMLDEFSKSLSGAAGQEMTALGTTLQLLNDQLAGQVDSLGSRQREMDEAAAKAQSDFANVVKWSTSQMQQSVGKALNEISERLGTMVGDVAGDLRSAANDAAERLSELSQRFHDSIVTANETVNGAAGLTAEFQQLMSEIGEAVAGVNQAVGEASGLIGPIEQAATGFSTTAESIEAASQQTHATIEGLKGAIENLAEMQEGISSAWESYAVRFENVDEALGSVFAELSAGLESYTGQVRAFIGELDKHTTSIVSSLAAAHTELSESMEDLTETLSRQYA